ncbi:MAG: hypothetical protein ACUVX8_00750 [Candidatus Zipacnadales bacterium]
MFLVIILLICAVLATWVAASGNLPDYLRRYKAAKPVLRPTHCPGDFDSDMVDCPQVLPWGDHWLMQYTGFDGQRYRIGVATSNDLVHWKRAGMILDTGVEGEWDYGSVGGGWLLQHERWWYLFYCGFPERGYEVGPGSTGLAKGRDIYHLEKLSEAPVLCLTPGEKWDSGGIYKASVYRVENRFVMFYNAKNRHEPWVEQTGLATSTDLLHWNKHPANPILPVGPPGAWDSRFASDPVMNLINGVWHLFYYGFDGHHAGDGVAICPDGDLTRWQKSLYNPILTHGEPGTYDSLHAHKPFVLEHKGVFYHYYCAVSETERTIALATSKPLD